MNDLRQLWYEELSDNKIKFFILNRDDIFELDDQYLFWFQNMLMQIDENRRKKQKNTNEYYVVNANEPYAPLIKSVIDKYENKIVQNEEENG